MFGFIEVSATSKPVVGDFGPQLELEVEADSNGAEGILIIEASDTGYTLGDISSWVSRVSANPIITPNVIVEIESWWDPDNTLFAMTNQLYLPDDPDFVFEDADFPFEAFFGNKDGIIGDGSSPFSMTTRMTITHLGGQDFTEAASRVFVAPIPVPASLPLLIGALGIAGTMVRRSKAKT